MVLKGIILLNIISLNQVCTILGVTRTSLYTYLKKDPTFPKPFKIGQGRLVRFAESDINAWLKTQHEASLSGQKEGV
jgi:predicted DNA-binding transcriptional regulator AlpA